jgi:ABC-type sugar transport system substrate-binding protein
MSLKRLIASGAAALLLTGAHAAQAKDIKVGVVNFTLCCSYFVGMDKAIADAASAYPNVKVISTDAKGDAAKFTSNVEDLLAQKVDGLIFSGGPLAAAPEALDAAKAAHVPVVQVDRELKGGEFASWVGPDNQAIGVGVGKYIAARMGGKGLIVVLRGGPADNTIGLARTEGMLSEVGKSGVRVEKAPDFGGWTVDGGFRLMENMLSKYPDVNAVFCENDSMCQGAQKAIGDAGKSKQVFLASVDGEKGTLKELMRDGSNYGATGANNSDQIGRAGFNRLMAILAGAVPPKQTVLPSPIITKDNAVKFYNPDSVF